MRFSKFNDPIVNDRIEDADLGRILDILDVDTMKVHGCIEPGDSGKFWFEVRDNDSGECVLHSDEIFPTEEAVRNYLAQEIEEIDSNV